MRGRPATPPAPGGPRPRGRRPHGPAVGFLLLGLLGGLAGHPARADEVRLVDGEVLRGAADREEGGRVTVRLPDGSRRLLPAGQVAEIVPDGGEEARVDRAAADAGAGAEVLAGAAWAAWALGRDGDALALARRAVAADADLDDARRLLRETAAGSGWAPGWAGPAWAAGTPPWWGGARRRALARAGGDPASRAAADAALAWLARHQDADGRIDADRFADHCPADDRCDGAGGGHHGERVPCAFDGVTTAAAAMAWMASGSTPVSGPWREQVAGALAFCAAWLNRPAGGFDDVWNRAWCVQAVAEALLQRRDVDLRRALDRGVATLRAGQRPDGGWSYVYPVGDVPTTACVLEALAVAAAVGAPIPADVPQRAAAFLRARVEAASGRTEYHDGAEASGYTPTTANTAAGLAARLLAGEDDPPALRSAQVSALLARTPRWTWREEEVTTPDGRRVRAQVGTLYPYAWYHTTIALERLGGSAWARWGGRVRAALRDGQRTDGHAAGSWDPLGPYSDSAGRTWTTALGALMLQAACRYPRAP